MDKRKLAAGCSVAGTIAVAVPVVLIGGGVAALALAPALFGGRLTALLEEQLDASLNATVRFDPPSVSLLKTFPSVGLHLANVSVVGRDAFDGVELARVGEVDVALDLFSVLGGGAVQVDGVTVKNAAIHVIIDDEGRANYDIAKPAPASAESSSSYAVDLRDVTVEGLALDYDDRVGHTHVVVEDLWHTSAGTLSNDTLAFDTHTTVAALTLEQSGITLLNRVRSSADVDFAIDQNTAVTTLGDNHVVLNDLLLGFAGTVAADGTDQLVDLSFSAPDTSFKTLLSLLPTAYTGDMKDVTASGTLALSGTAKGRLASSGDHLPAFDVSLGVSDARFQYPGLPSSVEGIGVDVKIRHPEGETDLTEVDVSRFVFTSGGAGVDGRMVIRHPSSDPDVELACKGVVDLAELGRAVPMEGQSATGSVDLDVALKGRVSDFEAQAADAIAASGRVRAKGLTWHTVDYPAVEFLIDDLDLTLAGPGAKIGALAVRFDRSDVSVTGSLENVVPYMLVGNPLRGDLAVASKLFDTAPLEGDPAAPPAAPSDEVLVPVPKDLDLTLGVALTKVFASGWEADDVRGKVRVKNGVLTFDDLSMGVLGGRVGVSGDYAASDGEAADLKLSLNLKDFDIARVAEGFPTLTRLVPFAKAASGEFDAVMSWKTRLGRDGTPDLATLTSNGSVLSRGIRMTPASLGAIATALGGANMKDVNVDGAELLFDLLDGKMAVKPVPIRLGTAPATLAGKVGVLERTLDLGLDVNLPTKGLPADLLPAGAAGAEAPVHVAITGPWDAPKIKVTAGALKAAAVEEVKQAVTAVLDDLVGKATIEGDKLVAEAHTQAEALRAAGKKAGATLRTEAKRQGDDLVAKAKDPLSKAAAREAASKLNEQADAKAKTTEREANSKATALEDTAKKKRDQLISEAQKKAALR